jgi:predicted Fe-Mo cluster-binding NifX family protein
MIIIISAQEPKMESPVNDRFGRTAWYIKVETETKKWEALENPGASQSGGAGIAAAQFVVNQKAGAVISGDFGPNAAGVLSAAAVEMLLFSDDIKTVDQAVEAFIQKKLPAFAGKSR